jgi:hypothetical protein
MEHQQSKDSDNTTFRSGSILQKKDDGDSFRMFRSETGETLGPGMGMSHGMGSSVTIHSPGMAIVKCPVDSALEEFDETEYEAECKEDKTSPGANSQADAKDEIKRTKQGPKCSSDDHQSVADSKDHDIGRVTIEGTNDHNSSTGSKDEDATVVDYSYKLLDDEQGDSRRERKIPTFSPSNPADPITAPPMNPTNPTALGEVVNELAFEAKDATTDKLAKEHGIPSVVADFKEAEGVDEKEQEEGSPLFEKKDSLDGHCHSSIPIDVAASAGVPVPLAKDLQADAKHIDAPSLSHKCAKNVDHGAAELKLKLERYREAKERGEDVDFDIIRDIINENVVGAAFDHAPLVV